MKLTKAQRNLMEALRPGSGAVRVFCDDSALLRAATIEWADSENRRTATKVRTSTYLPLIKAGVIERVDQGRFSELKLTPKHGGDWRELPEDVMKRIDDEIVLLLHAGRDMMRTCREDTSRFFISSNNPYYGEAFGIIRGLVLLGHGHYGAINKTGMGNLSARFSDLTARAMKEENFTPGGPPGRCEFCLERYKRDDITVAESKKAAV